MSRTSTLRVRPLRWLAPVVAAAAVLAGCAHLPAPLGDGLSFDERRTRLEAVSAWQMRGRLVVSTDQGGFQGSFRWEQHGDAIHLSVRGFMGAGAFEVTGSPDSLVVRSRGETWTLDDPESELSALLGWWMPVGSLHAWLLGLPDRAFESRTELGANEVVENLEQRFWRLSYVAYQLSEGLLVPRRIDMNHGEMELRVNVDTWSPTAALVSALN